MSDKHLETAAQFRRPEGERGIAIARSMDASNGAMNRSAIDSLGIMPGDKVLEIGHGVCGHLEFLPAGARYCGLEISEDMSHEAARLNRRAVAEGRASFALYDGIRVPFPDDFFDKALTVNTLYFWEDPAAFLAEMHRVLKPGGLLAVTFSLREFMETLPFTGYGFRLYGPEEAAQVLACSPLAVIETIAGSDTVCDPSGRAVERKFQTVLLRK